ncbi:hypothetical protein CMESO_34 (nucleomorph) [Chroomonas mesostigmatica CCMP1168]|uniref:Photolyase/cryptochrome alpha/beta domain-containing protein n=1 Tax=Chroomonas mesostigmatica CCMP1168 TaxID=1195612 RepID=J7G168_9CRYP|nr:hypothetical protein CMESO_34 [Chroomonas mesostigmatica CCMP1168]
MRFLLFIFIRIISKTILIMYIKGLKSFTLFNRHKPFCLFKKYFLFDYNKKKNKVLHLLSKKKNLSFFFCSKKINFRYLTSTFIPDKNRPIFWFRFDLRICNNPSLAYAFELSASPIFLICFDPRIIKFFGKKRIRFLEESIENLKKGLREKNFSFIYINGIPEKIILGLTKLFSTKIVIFSLETHFHWKKTLKKEKKMFLFLSKNRINLKLIFKNLNIYMKNLLFQKKKFYLQFMILLKSFQKKEILLNSFSFFRKNLMLFLSSVEKSNFLLDFIRENFLINFSNYFKGGEECALKFLKIFEIFLEKKNFFITEKFFFYFRSLIDFGCFCYEKIILEIKKKNESIFEFNFFYLLLKEFQIVKNKESIKVI